MTENSKNSHSVFDYTDYRKYLEIRLPVSGPKRGMRSRMAKALRCQTAFISRVLHGDAQFSLEHALAVNPFLGHSESEGDYFVLLVHYSRAGTSQLEHYYLKQMEEIHRRRQIIAERIQVKKNLSYEDQAVYYSAWYFAATHILLLIPGYQSPQAISDHLGIPLGRVSDVLEFLSSVGLAVYQDGIYQPGKARIHLDRSSPFFSKHHTHWRLQAIRALDQEDKESLFFSGPICLSENDAKKIRAKLMYLLEESEHIIGPSPNEAMFCMSLDFFRM